MNRKRGRLLAVVLLSNFAIVAGTVVFGWSQFTIALLFVADSLLVVARLLLERLFAGRPRGDATPPSLPYPVLDILFEDVLDKRGAIRVSDRLPRLYPRNLPFVLGQWIVVFWLAVLASVTWLALAPLDGGLDISLVLVLPLFVAKHALIIDTWAAIGIYERASARTVRRSRELLFTVFITCFVVFSLSAQSEDLLQVTVATMVLLVPKLLFDCRDAGIGPSLLVFDPSDDTTIEPVAAPAGKPRHVFRNDERVVSSWAIYLGLFYTVFPGLFFIVLPGLVGLTVSLKTSFLGIAAGAIGTLLVAVATSLLVLWLGQANVEYRVYDDVLVAYDQYLDAPQWSVPFEDIRAISIGENALGWRILPLVNPLPFEKFPVEVARSTDEDLQFKYLDQPEEFVRTVRDAIDDR